MLGSLILKQLFVLWHHQNILVNHHGSFASTLHICVSDFKRQDREILREHNFQMLSQQLLGKHLQIY